MCKRICNKIRSFTIMLLLLLLAFVFNAHGAQYGGPTQVITVYFAGTILRSDTVFHYGGGTPQGQHSVPELLQYLYHNQDCSDPNQHKIWVDGIGNNNLLDAGLAARNANRCRIRSFPPSPWDPTKKTIQFQRSGWFKGVYYTAGFECWDYRLHQALDTNPTTDLFRIMDANRTSPIILNIVGHSRGGILAMMLADKVSKLQRRYDSTSELMPEYERFLKINILNFDAVPGSLDQVGLIDESSHKFVKSHECFNLSPRVTNYVGFYAKDERQNIFEAVIPHHTPQTKSWHLALNGAHQTLVGNPRRDGHNYDAVTSDDYGIPIEILPGPWSNMMSGNHSAFDTSASDVGIVTSIIARELLSTGDWGRVRFKTSWRSNRPGLYYGSANCIGNEQKCARYFMGKYTSQSNMPLNTRSVMRSVTHPEYSIIIPEGGLQAWDFSKNQCSIRITDHRLSSTPIKEHGKCTFKARAGGDLEHVSLIDRTPDLSGSGITDKTAEEVCRKLVELTSLPWNCTQ
jgi:hypothetical protein